MATDHLIDVAKCPLCGGPNQCATAADPNAVDCWCGSIIFPNELLAKIPENAVRKTCVCQNCLEQHNASRDTTSQSQ